jgi:hypothetical protein
VGEKDISVEVVATKILLIRGKKVMLDKHLAELYGVTTGELNQAARRNKERFPVDFMYHLTKQEVINLKSQIVISSWGGVRKFPYVFTEQGVAMLSGVLHSKRAVAVNIAIMRAFVKLREILLTHKDLAEKLEELERKYELHEKDIQAIFGAIKSMLEPPPAKNKGRLGFYVDK